MFFPSSFYDGCGSVGLFGDKQDKGRIRIFVENLKKSEALLAQYEQELNNLSLEERLKLDFRSRVDTQSLRKGLKAVIDYANGWDKTIKFTSFCGHLDRDDIISQIYEFDAYEDMNSELQKILEPVKAFPSEDDELEVIETGYKVIAEKKELENLARIKAEENNALIAAKDQSIASLTADKKVLENEKVDLEILNKSLEAAKVSLQAELADAYSSSPGIRVFPFVNWTRANKSKAWYKDVDWSAIPFNHLNDDEKEKLDWSKINYAEANNNDSFDPALIDWSDISGAKKAHQIKAYKTIDWASVDFTALDEGDRESIDWTKINYAKAQASEEFDIFSLDWDFLNQLGTKFKKKVYQKVAWNKVDFSAGDSSAFDWSAINLKKAMASDTFTLDAVDIDETKQTKNFKRLSAALKKSSADDLLAGASDETLQAIGYQNFVGKIGDSLIQDFTTTSHNYSMILKPLSYIRASAVAFAMDGVLASAEDTSVADEIQTLVENTKSIGRKLFDSKADDRSLAWFEAQSGEDDQPTYSALDLQSFDQYTGNGESPLSSDSELWFVVDLGKRETTGESSMGIEVGPDVVDLDSTPIEVIPVIDQLIPVPAIDDATAPVTTVESEPLVITDVEKTPTFIHEPSFSIIDPPEPTPVTGINPVISLPTTISPSF